MHLPSYKYLYELLSSQLVHVEIASLQVKHDEVHYWHTLAVDSVKVYPEGQADIHSDVFPDTKSTFSEVQLVQVSMVVLHVEQFNEQSEH